MLAAVLALLGVFVLALAVGGAASAEDPSGLPSAGPLVDWGLPMARLAARVAAVGTVGTLLFAAVLLPGPAGSLPAASRRAARAASLWAAGWVAATAMTAVLTVTQLLGATPPLTALEVFLTDVSAGRAAVVVVVLAGLVTALSRRCTRASGAGALLVTALVALVVPAVLGGHASSADDHVIAVGSLAAHVVTAAVWTGGLGALVVHGRRPGDLAPAATRYSTVALGCFVLTGISGLTSGWILLGGAPAGVGVILGTGYGWLLGAKTAGLVVLGVLGLRHRRATLPRLCAGDPGAFRRLAGMEMGLMTATVAVAVALAASPPPALVPPASTTTIASGTAPASPPPAPAADPMSGHDHGELSVGVLVDEERFHVPAPVAPGALVTVFNSGSTEVTITAVDGSFDVVVPGHTLLTFPAPREPGSYPFISRSSAAFTDVLVVA